MSGATKYVTIQQRGIITLPKEFRSALNLNEADVVAVTRVGNEIIIRSAKDYVRSMEEIIKGE